MLGKEERLDVQSGGAADGDSVEVGGDLVARGGQILSLVVGSGNWTYLGPYLDL